MPKNPFTRGHSRALTKRHKIAVAGVATLGAAAVVFSAVPGNAETTTSEAAVSSAPVKYSSEQLQGLHADVREQLAAKALQSKAAEAKAQAEAKAKAKAAAAAKKKAAAAAAAKKAAQARKAKEAASRAAHRAKLKAAAPKSYANNLDGWIKESLAIMKAKGIPGSYNGLYRNIMRESSGNPNAINNWDINAINGIPSKGLLQVIPPTFQAYHVAGTSWNIYDPVANITAAANYAADKYGSMDNVNSAY
ncbi:MULTISPECIES: transglycosylase SLT domain-containing protein [unclassified Streptomyces]|uniref:transglycosylase SLT domain-containing protein n=1 Tax=unclassified Streptomyces TaxID=2593676 RepID=UPI002474F218|nr:MULTISPECIES: transglycosylase SLT domain-containing protein [unclassified Streptomyces]MDH6448938.1 flagellar biosynthesis GTPase FlhF [Streptomyces sp. SAI-119]MDH6500481.1 flagellar biosynthesis GTPase FlhF [Streptomyces sp. SAI-149]